MGDKICRENKSNYKNEKEVEEMKKIEIVLGLTVNPISPGLGQICPDPRKCVYLQKINMED